MVAIIDLERGIPSKRESPARVDYVPALCTHRPSLLPIGWLSEHSGSLAGAVFTGRVGLGRSCANLRLLEEVKVVTRFP